jgi:hypothetical protein
MSQASIWSGIIHTKEVVHVGFVVDKAALKQFFLRDFRLSPVNIIPPWFLIHKYHLGNEQ